MKNAQVGNARSAQPLLADEQNLRGGVHLHDHGRAYVTHTTSWASQICTLHLKPTLAVTIEKSPLHSLTGAAILNECNRLIATPNGSWNLNRPVTCCLGAGFCSLLLTYIAVCPASLTSGRPTDDNLPCTSGGRPSACSLLPLRSRRREIRPSILFLPGRSHRAHPFGQFPLRHMARRRSPCPANSSPAVHSPAQLK